MNWKWWSLSPSPFQEFMFFAWLRNVLKQMNFAKKAEKELKKDATKNLAKDLFKKVEKELPKDAEKKRLEQCMKYHLFDSASQCCWHESQFRSSRWEWALLEIQEAITLCVIDEFLSLHPRLLHKQIIVLPLNLANQHWVPHLFLMLGIFRVANKAVSCLAYSDRPPARTHMALGKLET